MFLRETEWEGMATINLAQGRDQWHLGKITGHFSPTVPPSAAGCSRVLTSVKTPGGEIWNKEKHRENFRSYDSTRTVC